MFGGWWALGWYRKPGLEDWTFKIILQQANPIMLRGYHSFMVIAKKQEEVETFKCLFFFYNSSFPLAKANHMAKTRIIVGGDYEVTGQKMDKERPITDE